MAANFVLCSVCLSWGLCQQERGQIANFYFCLRLQRLRWDEHVKPNRLSEQAQLMKRNYFTLRAKEWQDCKWKNTVNVVVRAGCHISVAPQFSFSYFVRFTWSTVNQYFYSAESRVLCLPVLLDNIYSNVCVSNGNWNVNNWYVCSDKPIKIYLTQTNKLQCRSTSELQRSWEVDLWIKQSAVQTWYWLKV